MSSNRNRILSLVLLGVLAAGGTYFLGSGQEPPAEKPPRAAEPGPEPSAAQSPVSVPESAEVQSPRDNEKGEGVLSERKAAPAEAEISEDETSSFEEDELPSDYEILTQSAMDFPNMKELDPEDPAYDPRLEAHQAFAPMEKDLLVADPLDPAAWRRALDRHRLRNTGVSKRAEFLRKSGHPQMAEDLMVEWSRVYGTWQARAYGRSGPPGHKSPPR